MDMEMDTITDYCGGHFEPGLTPGLGEAIPQRCGAAATQPFPALASLLSQLEWVDLMCVECTHFCEEAAWLGEMGAAMVSEAITAIIQSGEVSMDRLVETTLRMVGEHAVSADIDMDVRDAPRVTEQSALVAWGLALLTLATCEAGRRLGSVPRLKARVRHENGKWQVSLSERGGRALATSMANHQATFSALASALAGLHSTRSGSWGCVVRFSYPA